MSEIETLLCRKAQSFTLDVPPGDGWLRMSCPWCGGDRAQIHHKRGMFWCPHTDCLKRFAVAGEWSVTAQFRDQVHRAIQVVRSKHKYGAWVKDSEATEFCQTAILGYNRDGLIDDWYDIAKGDPDQVRRYCQRELTCDLSDHYRAKVRRSRREATELLLDDGGDIEHFPAQSAPRAFDPERYPFSMCVAEGMTHPQIARHMRCSERTVRRRLEAEKVNLAKYRAA